MTVELVRTHPLESRAAALAGLPESVRATPEPWTALVDVRVGDPTAVTGLELPGAPNRFTEAGGVRAVWLGPDEWLVLGADDAPDDLLARVQAAVAPAGGTVVDVSATRVALRLQGARVRDVLARSCAIDLHPRVFGRGSAVQTTVAQCAVVLIALSDAGDDLLVFVRSSFAGHLADWLVDAALEYPSPR